MGLAQKGKPSGKVAGVRPFDPVAMAAYFEHTEQHGWPNIEVCGASQKMWSAVLKDQWDLVFGVARQNDSMSHLVAAARWFGSRDFCMVCDLALQEPDAVMDRFRARFAKLPEGHWAKGLRGVSV